MTAETHSQLASFIWSICNLLRGPYKRNEYRKVILPLTVLRRFDCLLAPTKAAVLESHDQEQAGDCPSQPASKDYQASVLESL
jgi:type I restriction enzyme M protein